MHVNKKLLHAVKVLILVFTEHNCAIKYILNNFLTVLMLFPLQVNYKSDYIL